MATTRSAPPALRPPRRRRPLRSLVTAARWHQRLLASVLAAIAVACALASTSPPSLPSVPVVVTARDLTAGHVLDDRDLEVVRVPVGAIPAHAFTTVADVPQRALVGPKRAGIVVTDVDVIAPGLLSRYGAEVVAVPVRIADAGSLAYVRVGDRIDLIAAGTVPTAGGTTGSTAVVATRVPVLAVAPADATETGEGGLLIVATTSTIARAIAGAAVTSRVSVALRPSN
jgi:pilus assembly protein CpaB